MIPRYDVGSAMSLQRYLIDKKKILIIKINFFFHCFRVPLQTSPRRVPKIIPSINQKHGANDTSEISDIQSLNSTITSVNSISSLLKEKLQLSLPQALRSSKKRQNADYRQVKSVILIESKNFFFLNHYFYLLD